MKRAGALRHLRVTVSSSFLSTIGLYDHFPSFVTLVNFTVFSVDFFIRLLRTVPFSFIGCGIHSCLVPLPEFPRIDSAAVIRGALVWPFPLI